jgi:hypothetical protein
MATNSGQPLIEVQPRRRRWLSYSLRSLLVFVTISAVGLGWVASERRQSDLELQIAKELEARGATVDFSGLFDVPEATEVCVLSDQPRLDQSWWRTALGQLLGPRAEKVFAIYLEEPFDDLTVLADLKSVKFISLARVPLKRQPQNKRRPQVLNLAPLAGLKHLAFLSLDDVPVSGLSPLAGLRKLEYLSLRDSNSVRDVTPLVGLENLKVLSLVGNPVSDLSPLSALTNLNTLDVSMTKVSDLAPLSRLSGLEALYLNHTKVSDVSALAGLKSLLELQLRETQVSETQVESLQQALPNCTIRR